MATGRRRSPAAHPGGGPASPRAARWLVAVLLLPVVAASQDAASLAQLSLEELMEIELFTAARRGEELRSTAAAAAVLTADDLRRAGVTSVPEALRLVPGLEVARVDASKWAVSARGFTDLFANKLLVLVDGRSVYSPLFSGVFWDIEAVPIEEIERIEVVRGPGATLWGANAVNGVVNIITRAAAAAPALRLTTGYGTGQRLRAGFGVSSSGLGPLHLRVYGETLEQASLAATDGTGPAADGWQLRQVGLRADGRLSPRDSLSLQAGLRAAETEQAYHMSLSPADLVPQRLETTTSVHQLLLLGVWTRHLGPGQDLEARLAYQHGERDDAPVQGHTDVVDLDLQHRVDLAGGLGLVWGGGTRRSRDRMQGTFGTRFEPAGRTYDQKSAFVQGTLAGPAPGLRLILGAKLEEFDLGGLALQPNVRVAWTPKRDRTVWAAVSRAARTPSRADHDLRARRPAPPELVPEGFPATFVEERGSRGFVPEALTAWEAGVRGRVAGGLVADLAAFYNRYDHLRTTEPAFPVAESGPAGPYLVVPLVVHNRMAAQTGGLELGLDWRPRPGLRLRPAYTWLRMDIDLDADSRYLAGLTWPGVSPRHQARLHAAAELGPAFEVDLLGRYVGALRDIGVDGYVSLNARLGWRLRPHLELVLAGDDLLAADHAEFRIPHLPIEATDPRRGVRLALTWTPSPGPD